MPGATFVPGDLGDAEARAALIAAVRAIGEPSIVVTNAGGPPTGRFEEIASEQWRSAFETNVLAALEIVRAFLPSMRAQGLRAHRERDLLRGEGAVPEHVAVQRPARRAHRRDGLDGARGGRRSGVTVNNVLPGLMDTGALGRVIRDRMKRTGQSEDEVRGDMAASVPMRRLGTAEDFGAHLRLPVLAPRGLHHRPERLRRRRPDEVADLT